MPINTFADIEHAFYINLEHRVDRNTHVISQLKQLNIEATRFNAIRTENGAIGCTMSHLKILQNAEKNNLDHVFIVEDDIQFLNPELFITQFNKFIEIHENNWDVILLGGNNKFPYEQPDETCIQVSTCQTTTGYIVNKHYISTLCNNVKMGLDQLIRNPKFPHLYAIDVYWFKLQKCDKWFLIIPTTVTQLEGYSDIEKRTTNYTQVMTHFNKKIVDNKFILI